MATHGKRRALGQHFLRDTKIARLIAKTAVDEAVKHGCKTLLEIGPGRGAITRPLMEELQTQSSAGGSLARFVICERDRDLGAFWKDAARAADIKVPIDVEVSDFLELKEDAWNATPPVAVASNLPYSAGTAIFTLLAGSTVNIPVMVLMFQAEVAKRLYAQPGTKDWGRLSVWTQNRWDVRRLVAVPPGAFNPPPEVNSEVVVVMRRQELRIPATAEGHTAEIWEPLLKSCFTHRRKMLRSGLPASSPFRKALDKSGVDPTLRPEALSWTDWERLLTSC